jgi:hypothetical protein
VTLAGAPSATALQLRPEGTHRCTLLAGFAAGTLSGRRGSVAVLRPRTVAAYMTEGPHTTQVTVFRTAPHLPSMLVKIAGVAPSVELLLSVTGRRRSMLVVRLLRALDRWGVPLELPSPSFWSRVAALAGSRAPIRRPLLRDLLARDGVSVTAGIRRRYRPPS